MASGLSFGQAVFLAGGDALPHNPLKLSDPCPAQDFFCRRFIPDYIDPYVSDPGWHSLVTSQFQT